MKNENIGDLFMGFLLGFIMAASAFGMSILAKWAVGHALP